MTPLLLKHETLGYSHAFNQAHLDYLKSLGWFVHPGPVEL